MARPRGFDEAEVTRLAAEFFADRTYDGASIDDLVAHLGVHRNSLYKTFGSKRGLYLAALRWSLEHDVAPLVDRVAKAATLVEALGEALASPSTGAGLELLLLAAVERAPVDGEVADMIADALAALDRTIGAVGVADDGAEGAALATVLTAAVLGLRVRARSRSANAEIGRAGAALAARLQRD